MGNHPLGWKLLDKQLAGILPDLELAPDYMPLAKPRNKKHRGFGPCSRCERDQRTAGGCKRVPHVLNGLRRDPVPVGAPRDILSVRPPYQGVKPGRRCKGCNALFGCFHHPGCHLEACPFCPMPAYRCNCH